MKGVSHSLPTFIFTLRLWREDLGSGKSEWRGEIKNLSTSEVRLFRIWEEIAKLLSEMLSGGTES